jgi:hypothetical protein
MGSRRKAFRLGLLLLANAIFASRGAAQRASPEPREPRACWTSIQYAPLPIPSARGQSCSVSVRSDARPGPEDQQPRLQVAVTWSERESEPIPEAMTKPERMSVRMHLPNGNVVETQNSFRAGGITTEKNRHSLSRIGQFPWGANTLDEAWFELKIDEVVYWLEVPYGFTRDPLGALPPSEPKAGPGKVAPAMAKLGPCDRVACWWKIGFDLGVIQKDRRLQMVAVNDRRRTWIAMVHGESVPGSFSGPNVHPRIVDEDGAWVESTNAGLRQYTFALYEKGGRSWGMLTASLYGYTWSGVVPSSLFKAGHATVGRDHGQSVALPSLDLGGW